MPDSPVLLTMTAKNITTIFALKGMLISLMACLFLISSTHSVSYAGGEKTVSVLSVKGFVKVVLSGSGNRVVPAPRMTLTAGDRIVTGENSNIEIIFDEAGHNIVRLEEHSILIVKLGWKEQVELRGGEIFVLLRGLKSWEKISSKDAKCSLRGKRNGLEDKGRGKRYHSFRF